jgi:hypothetical protein
MSVSQMRVEDRLAGASNWLPWKARMVFVLEDLELWDIVEAVVPPIPVTAPILVVEFRKRNNKAKRIICDAVRDHIIPHFTGRHVHMKCGHLCASCTRALMRTGRWFFMNDSGGFTCSRMSQLLHSLVDTHRSEISLQSFERL